MINKAIIILKKKIIHIYIITVLVVTRAKKSNLSFIIYSSSTILYSNDIFRTTLYVIKLDRQSRSFKLFVIFSRRLFGAKIILRILRGYSFTRRGDNSDSEG